MRRRIAILASGTGSNAENLAAYFQNSDVAEVALLIADREAPVIDRLKPYGVPAVIGVLLGAIFRNWQSL